MIVTLYSANGKKLIDVDAIEGSYCDRTIMGGNTLQLVARSDRPLDISIGAYAEYRGHRYTMMYSESIKKNHTKELEYTIILYGEEEYLTQCIIKDTSVDTPYRVKFALTAKPVDFIRYIVNSLNKHYGGGWTVGDIIDATEQTLAFSHEYCLKALSRVAEAFNTEYSIEGKRISLGKVTRLEDRPLPMSYGDGNGFRPGTGRHNDGKKVAIGKLYVEGGSRNIDYSTYGAQTLLLPKSATLQYNGRTYRTDAHGMYITCDQAVGTAEGSFDGAAVYPMREGTITAVIKAKDGYDFTDTSIPDNLNYNDYRIKGEKAVVVFQTGALAGREFALVQTKDKLTGYIHAERKFKIVSEEQDGYMMPGGNFVPKAGDKYAVYNISLPTEYLSNASQRLFDEAVRYFDSVLNPPYIFSGEVDPIWAKKEWTRVSAYMIPGAHIRFTDPQYHPSGSVIRITGVRTPLSNPYAPQLTLSNTPSTSQSVGNALSKLEADTVIAAERHRQSIAYAKREFDAALQTQEALQRAIDTLGDEFDKATLRTMQVIVGSAALQFRYLDGDPIVAYVKEGRYITVSQGKIQHLSYGRQGVISPKAEYYTWSLAKYKSGALDPDKTYYLYAKVGKKTHSGEYLPSLKPMPFDDGDHLNLLVGVISTEHDGNRSLASMYGFSELTPDALTTKLLKSSISGRSINLDTGEIIGTWVFKSAPDTTPRTLTQWAEEVDSKQATLDTKIDNIKVGTRNLIRGGKKLTVRGGVTIIPAEDAVAGDEYVLSVGRAVNVQSGRYDSTRFLIYDEQYKVNKRVRISDTRQSVKFTVGVTGLRIALCATISWEGVTEFYDIILTKGNQIVDFVEAPEDIEERYQKLIAGVDVEFALGDSMTVSPSSGWQTKAPAPQTGKYLWQRTKTTLKDGNVTYKGVTCIQGKNGTDGIDGAKGRGVKSVTEQYYHSTSMTALTGGSWGSVAPTPAPGKWIWTRSVIAYDDNTSTTTSPICVTGDKGDKGAKGDDGAPGKDGNPGKDGKDAINYSAGLLLYGDPTFAEGVNWTHKYNNAGGNTTTWERVVKPADCPSSSTHAMSYKYLGGGSTQPGLGGFTYHTTSRANAVFVYRIIAKIPVGYKISYATNPYGDGGTQQWLTEQLGTGKYEEYVILLKCGSTGSFSSIGYFYFDKSSVNTPNAPFEVIVSYATAFDMTSAPNYYQQLGKEQRAREEAERKLRQDLGNANKTIIALQKLTEEIQSGKLDASRFADIQYLLDALQKNSAVQTGILLSNDIILSRATDGTVTAYLSGEQGEGRAMLRCGVKDAFTPNETARVTIWSNGTVEIGNMRHVVTDNGGDYIEFEDKAANHTYMQIGGNATSESDMILGSTKHTTYQLGTLISRRKSVMIDNFVNSEGRRGLNYTLDVGIIRDERSAGGRPMTLNKTTIDIKLQVAIAGSNGALKQTLTSEIKRQVVELLATTKMEYMFGKIVFSVPESAIAKGDTIMASVILRTSDDSRYDEGGWGLYVKDATVTIPKDTLKSLVTITKDKVAFFFGRQKYLLFNYFNDWLLKIVGNVLVQGTLKAEYIETSGAVLAGGEVDQNGSVVSPFGKYKNRQGWQRPAVERLGSGTTCYIRVYHSIGSNKYVPFVTPANTPYSDQPSIVDKQANYFDVRFYNTSGQSYHYPFNYICHRAD